MRKAASRGNFAAHSRGAARPQSGPTKIHNEAARSGERMKNSYNGVEVPRDGAAIEYGAPASQGKTPPFAKGAPFLRQGEQDGAPAKALSSGTAKVERAYKGSGEQMR